jgi:hypothetical protein
MMAPRFKGKPNFDFSLPCPLCGYKMHLFLANIADCLDPKLREQFWHVMEDPYPGYGPARKITGGLLPKATWIGDLQGVRYDDELAV